MQELTVDTAALILVGPFVDSVDGVTPETGITLAAADTAGLMKEDGEAFVNISTRTFTHVAGGMYTLALLASDVDTIGRLTVFIRDDSVCLPRAEKYMVVTSGGYAAVVTPGVAPGPA